MTNDDPTAASEAETTPALQRRFLLRGGAVLVGAAGATALGGALNPTAASAANGDNLVLGSAANAETASTTLKITGKTPALILTSTGGPTLRLSPLDTIVDGPLSPGDLIGTSAGPSVAIDYGTGAGAEFDYLATGRDLDLIPTVIAQTPERVLDTRTDEGRASILATSTSSALDSSNRLKAGQWLDVLLGPADSEFELGGAFINLASIGSVGNGYLTAYPSAASNNRPGSSTLNFRQGASIANGTLVALGVVDNGGDPVYALRVHTSQTTHVVVDLNGVIISAPQPTAGKASPVRQRRVDRQAKRAAALRKGLRR